MEALTSYARLGFWVPAGRLAEFEAGYQAWAVPVLHKHGLVESAERGWQPAVGVFSRLFAVESPAAVAEKEQALQADPAWQEVVRELRQVLAVEPQEQALAERWATALGGREWCFELYSTPASPGRQVLAGPGKQQLAGQGRGHWRTFDATDGLPGGTIRALLQDPEGALWIGSYGGGLSRYDGQQFKTFTAKDGLPSHLVQSVVLAQDGALWIGTHGQGIYRYDGQGFENFTTADGLVSDLVLRVFQDRQGNLWVGTWSGLSRYDGQGFVSFTTQDGLPAEEVHAICQDREGYLWFGTGTIAGGSAGGVCRYDGQRFTPFTAAQGLPAKQGVWAILQDQEGALWFGTAGGVSRYDGREFKTFTTADGLGSNEVWAVFQDQQGALWFGTKYGGVSRYDGKTFLTFTAQDGLAANSLEAIFQDREGLLWFGTWNGLSRYDAHTFTTFTTQDGLADDQVYSVCQDQQGALWFGTAGGLCRYDGHTFTTFTGEDGLPDSRVSRIFPDREGRLWLSSATQSSGRGICRYDGHTFTTFTTADGLADDRVFSICQDREGALWFATGNGMKVSHYDGRVFTTFTTANDLPLAAEITAMIQDREGRFWFATHGAGICRYDLSAEAQAGGHTFTPFTTRDGLAHDIVRSILQDREGILWFGTVAGVCRYDGYAFTTPEGLAGSDLGSGEEPAHYMLQDRRGVLWTGIRSGGVRCYDGQVFQRLTQQDGLPSNAIMPAFEDREGNLWFATNKGVTRYRPPPPSSPSLLLDAVVADRRYEGVSEVQIPDSMKVTAFEFHSLSFKTHPEATVYRYRLAGYEDEWKNTPSRRVEYQDLPIGEYTFQVRAVDRDFNYSEPASVKITVLPDPHVQALTEALSGVTGQFVGQSRALRQVQADLAQVALTDLTVLILGETGTGKGLAAGAIHAQSPRQGGPFIQVNCGAIPKELVESELFGHERGAFTGAISRKLGKFELAEGGTLFLDEIGDLPLGSQRALLQLLQEQTFQRVGGAEVLRGEVRIIAATNRDLEVAVQRGEFRKDLFYRLNGFVVELPPLRQRREDIPLLVAYFAGEFARHLSRPAPAVDPEVMGYLQAYSWPGNVRELEHLVQRAVLLCKEGVIRREDVAVPSPEAREGLSPVDRALETIIQEGNASGGGDLLERAEEVVLRLALTRTQGNKTRAAALLHTDRKKVERRTKKYRLED